MEGGECVDGAEVWPQLLMHNAPGVLNTSPESEHWPTPQPALDWLRELSEGEAGAMAVADIPSPTGCFGSFCSTQLPFDLFLQRLVHEHSAPSDSSSSPRAKEVPKALISFLRNSLRCVQDGASRVIELSALKPADNSSVLEAVFEYVAAHLARKQQDGRQDWPLYVKDWHLPRSQSLMNAHNAHPLRYTLPTELANDWVQACYAAHQDQSGGLCQGDDYRFVYVGSRLSWTPLHRDVFGSYSWSGNVLGRKLWLLFPPHCRQHLTTDAHSFTYEQDFFDRFTTAPNTGRAPQHQELLERECVAFVQMPGQIIFVPSGWIHQVHNLDPIVLSINHNWGNGYNVHRMWRILIEHELAAVVSELNSYERISSDGHVYEPRGEPKEDDGKPLVDRIEAEQQMLKALAGVNLSDFLSYMEEAMTLTAADPPHRDVENVAVSNVRRVLEEMSKHTSNSEHHRCLGCVAHVLGISDRIQRMQEEVDDRLLKA